MRIVHGLDSLCPHLGNLFEILYPEDVDLQNGVYWSDEDDSMLRRKTTLRRGNGGDDTAVLN